MVWSEINIITKERTYGSIQTEWKCNVFCLCYQEKQKGTYVHLLICWMKMGVKTYATVQADMFQLSILVQSCCYKFLNGLTM